MQGVDNNDFDGLKSSLDMGFTSVLSMLNIINNDNEKTRTLIGSILDRLDDIAENISKSFKTSLGNFNFGSTNNFSKLQYKVQLDIFKTIKNIGLLQKKFFDHFNINKIKLQNTTEETQKSDTSKQNSFLGGKIINATNFYHFSLEKGNNKTLDYFGKGMKELNAFMKNKKEKFDQVINFFKGTADQLTTLNKLLKPAALGFSLLAGSLILLQFVSFINVFKLATILPILGVSLGLFIHAIIKSMSGIKGGIMGMWKVWNLMKALPEILVNLGKGILMLSIALVVYNFVGWDALAKFTISLIGLGLAFKFMTDEHSWGGTAKLMMVVGVILAVTSSLIRTKDIPWDAVFKMPVAIGALGLALNIGGFDKLDKLKLMNMLSISLLLITFSLIQFKNISWENIIKYNVFITGLGLSLRTMKKDISTMTLFAMGMVVLALSLVDFGEIKWVMILPVIGFIGMLGVVINKFVLGKMGGASTINNMTDSFGGGGFRGGGLIGFALGLFLLTFAIQRFGGINWQTVFKAIAIIGILGLTFKLFFQEKQSIFLGQKSRIQVPSMIGFALGLGLLVLALDAVSEIKWKSVFQLVTLMVAIGLIFKFLMPQKSKTSGMLGFAMGVGLLLLALDAMTEISWESVFKLVGFMLGIGFAMKLIGKTGFFQMIALAGSIYVMVYSLEYLNKVNPKLENILLFGLFVGVAAGAMFFIGQNILTIGLGVAAVLGIGWATGVMADALIKVSTIKFNWQSTLTFFGGVLLLGTAMLGLGALIMGTGGIAGLFIGVGAAAILFIAGASLLMAKALASISELSYSEQSFDQFSYGIKQIINAYIDLDPIATVASVVSAVATIPILISVVFAIGVLKLIDFTFSGNNTLSKSTEIFGKSLGLLINSFNDNIGAWVSVKAGLKAVAILPILGTMYLASLLLDKISKTEWDLKKLDSFNLMFSSFITQTVETINTHKNALLDAQPGIKSITQLINVASGLANVVRNISNLRFVEMGVVNGKLVVTGVRQLGPADFENVGKSITKLLLALIDPIKALGMDSDTWRIGSDTIQNPFKNNNFLNGIDNIKKITDAFKPFVDSITMFTKTGIVTDNASTDKFTYGVQQTAKSYGYVFWKLAQIKRANLLKDSFTTIDAIEKYNELWDDLNFDTFKDYSNLFNSFIDRLADQNKWKIIHKNINVLTTNLQKTVKAINSIDLQKAAALEVNVKQLSDKSNIEHIKEVIEQFVNLFGIIGQNQYQQAMAFNNGVNNFDNAVSTFNESNVASTIDKVKNREGFANYEKIKKGEMSLNISNMTASEKQLIKEGGYDSNGDGILSNSDVAITSGVEAKLDKLIVALNTLNSPFRGR